ncbi:MAG: YfcE family phosphodiesterase [Chloroflexi bacterium]|nr:YfcE family phosphodiesterase [Chloroflexota bacterium]
MKIGLLSDVHCNLTGLRMAMALMADCAEIVCAGDLMFQYRFSNDVAQVLDSAGVRTIVGNHDKSILHLPNQPLRSSPSVDPRWLRYVADLPDRLTLELAGVRILVVHGAPWDPAGALDSTYVYPHDTRRLARMREVAADVVVLGHTHVPMAERVAGRLVLNPGSCGVPAGLTRGLTCATLDLDTLRVEMLHFAG